MSRINIAEKNRLLVWVSSQIIYVLLGIICKMEACHRAHSESSFRVCARYYQGRVNYRLFLAIRLGVGFEDFRIAENPATCKRSVKSRVCKGCKPEILCVCYLGILDLFFRSFIVWLSGIVYDASAILQMNYIARKCLIDPIMLAVSHTV